MKTLLLALLVVSVFSLQVEQSKRHRQLKKNTAGAGAGLCPFFAQDVTAPAAAPSALTWTLTSTQQASVLVALEKGDGDVSLNLRNSANNVIASFAIVTKAGSNVVQMSTSMFTNVLDTPVFTEKSSSTASSSSSKSQRTGVSVLNSMSREHVSRWGTGVVASADIDIGLPSVADGFRAFWVQLDSARSSISVGVGAPSATNQAIWGVGHSILSWTTLSIEGTSPARKVAVSLPCGTWGATTPAAAALANPNANVPTAAQLGRPRTPEERAIAEEKSKVYCAGSCRLIANTLQATQPNIVQAAREDIDWAGSINSICMQLGCAVLDRPTTV